jgi:hypothetical protein
LGATSLGSNIFFDFFLFWLIYGEKKGQLQHDHHKVSIVFFCFFKAKTNYMEMSTHIYLNYKPAFMCLFGEGRKTQDECCKGCNGEKKLWEKISEGFKCFIFFQPTSGLHMHAQVRLGI